MSLFGVDPVLDDITCRIKYDFRMRRITYEKAAKLLGSSKQGVTNQLSGKRRFTPKMAERFNKAFGYSTLFLMHGVGDMFEPGKEVINENFKYYALAPEDLSSLTYSEVSQRASIILQVMNDQLACDCFQKFVSGDKKDSDEALSMLEEKYCADIIISNSKKSGQLYRKIRNFYSKVELESAKELSRIESIAVETQTIDVNLIVERFKNKVYSIIEEYSKEYPDIVFKKIEK